MKWSPTKRCQETLVEINGKANRHAFWGFDPNTKRWRGMAFNSDGAWSEMTQGPEVLQAKFGKPFKTRVVGSRADGTRVVSEWVTTLIDQDHYTIKIYEKENGKRKRVLAIECERQK